MKISLTKCLTVCVIMIFAAISCGSNSKMMVKKLPNIPKLQTPMRMIQSKPKPIKCKLYYGETIMIVWYDLNGDDKCDGAVLYEKSGDSFIINILQCKQADESDMLLEPRI